MRRPVIVGGIIGVVSIFSFGGWRESAAQSQSTSQSVSQQSGQAQLPPTTETQPRAAASGQSPRANSVSPRAGTFGNLRERPWFADQGVRRELGFDEKQFNQLNQAYRNAWQRYNQSERGLATDLPDEKRMQRQRAFRNDFDRDFSRSRDAVLSDAQRRERYNQLYYQYRGYDAFGDPDAARTFNLTPQQQQQLGQFREDWNSRMAGVGELYATDPNAATQQYRELQVQLRNRLGSTLTPAQRRQWEQASGAPYDFSPDAYFGTEPAPETQNPNGAINPR
jgi:hypothetical protein